MRIPKEKWEKAEDAQLLWEKIRKEGKYLVVKNTYADAKYTTDGDNTSVNSSASGIKAFTDNPTDNFTASSTDWDAVLDEYENYVNKLASVYKKVQSGDMNAMTEYGSLLESAESLNRKLENAKNDMTAAQIVRLNKIISKMSGNMM